MVVPDWNCQSVIGSQGLAQIISVIDYKSDWHLKVWLAQIIRITKNMINTK